MSGVSPGPQTPSPLSSVRWATSGTETESVEPGATIARPPGQSSSTSGEKSPGAAATAQPEPETATLFVSSCSATVSALSTKAWSGLLRKATAPATATGSVAESLAASPPADAVPSTLSPPPSAPSPSMSSKTVTSKAVASSLPRLPTSTLTVPESASVCGSTRAAETSTPIASRSGAATIGSRCTVVLSASSSSSPGVSVTLALLTRSVDARGHRRVELHPRVRVAVAPSARSKGGQETRPPERKPSSLAVKKIASGGSVSASLTPRASWKPVLVTSRV